jgi:hypothetical protein
MTQSPVWLLDIDGVLNASTKDAWPASDWVEQKVSNTCGRWRILIAQPVMDFIRQVHVTGRAEIRWHSTWQDDSNAVARVFGLPELPVQDAPEVHHARGFLSRGDWWKAPAALRVVQDGRRLLWTDDDIAADLTPADRTALGNSLLISPDPSTGLDAVDLLTIDTWLFAVNDLPAERSVRHAD